MTTAPAVHGHLEELSEEECRVLLRLTTVGRIGFVVEGRPVILPVNYRLSGDELGPWIVLRTRPGNTIDAAPAQVAFEIDGIDVPHRQGWSVLVRGVLRHLNRTEVELFSERFDPAPWPQADRTSWLAIELQTVSGRRLLPPESEWELSSDAYL